MSTATCSVCRIQYSGNAPIGHPIHCTYCRRQLVFEADTPNQLFPTTRCPSCSTSLAVLANETQIRCGMCGTLVTLNERHVRATRHYTTSQQANSGGRSLNTQATLPFKSSVSKERERILEAALAGKYETNSKEKPRKKDDDFTVGQKQSKRATARSDAQSFPQRSLSNKPLTTIDSTHHSKEKKGIFNRFFSALRNFLN